MRGRSGRVQRLPFCTMLCIAGGSQKPPSVASDAPKLHRLQHVATALTRARKARLPSPWTGRGILKEGSRKKNERERGE